MGALLLRAILKEAFMTVRCHSVSSSMAFSKDRNSCVEELMNFMAAVWNVDVGNLVPDEPRESVGFFFYSSVKVLVPPQHT
jgi:hypothetical protein